MHDKELRHHVEHALDWEPGLDASDIGVSVDEGVVTLRGNVTSYSDKVTAGRAALRVYGTKAVANDLEVHVPNLFERTDTEIAQVALAALEWNTRVPVNRVTLNVMNGHLTLNGHVDWAYQKEAAARTVRDLVGVKSVTNHIAIVPHAEATDVREKVVAALTRSAETDARRINVTAEGSKIILSGNVHSWTEQQAAERAAWAAPGVTEVDDRLAIVP